MKTIYKLKTSLVLLLLMLNIGCSDFFDNTITSYSSNPSLTFPVGQTYLAKLHGSTMNYLGNFMVYNYSGVYAEEDLRDLLIYNFTDTFYDEIFDDSYEQVLSNLNYVINYDAAESDLDYDAFRPLSRILRAFLFQYLVDLYGDVPYSEAGLRAENLYPKFDDAETIYKAVIDELTETANLCLTFNFVQGSTFEDPSEVDVMFGGDMDKWAQFANTIKLRMLIRLSNTNQDDYIIAEIDKINANGAGYITSDVNVNPGYLNQQNKQNPFFAAYGQSTTGDFTDQYAATAASDFVLEYLQSINDQRYTRLYSEAVNGGYKGSQQTTDLPDIGFTSDDLSHIGPGLVKSSEQDQPIMLYSESLFLQAEAMLRGYIPGGDTAAESLYKSAIEESYIYLGVTDATNEAITYYSQDIVNVNWASSPDKIEAVLTQKWIALNGTNAIESWIELTRTGFPSGLPLPEGESIRPVRLLYSGNEVLTNWNTPAQSESDAFNSPPFWK
ncbi:SusD/RagB family nutrient-binding outer membrane lipoprotein [uncultured Polaribacter sp.]|uniref:SusD/RagB family nutrient-binding outer membrane lipoprotein n=1 Tax=uncultured Polaribacter sp. TaxID=174711 RepID=UPI0026353762|nr:SusD/RagB family nutrient-binding outer membrane lipoprotein [uncultured Polaribacter sp.]